MRATLSFRSIKDIPFLLKAFKKERPEAYNTAIRQLTVRSQKKMGDDPKKNKRTSDASESNSSEDEVFWFSLVKQKIPNELLGTPRRRASLKLRITKRYKIIAAASSLAVFAILAYIFGFVLRLF